MADNDINVLGGNDLLRCFDYMRQKRLARNLMQDLGAAGFKTRTFTRRHDHYGEIGLPLLFRLGIKPSS